MKPSIIKVEKTLVKIGLGMLLIELAADIGKVSMLRTVKKFNSKAADEVMNAMDYCNNCGVFHGFKKYNLKIIMYMYKICIED